MVDQEALEYQRMHSETEETLDHLKDGIYKLFLATGAKPDDFITITGSSSIT